MRSSTNRALVGLLSHCSNSAATIRSLWTPAAAGEASQTIGGPMIAGSRSPSRVAAGVSARIIPVSVAPPVLER